MKVYLTNPNNVPFALSNEFKNPFMLKEELNNCEMDELDDMFFIINGYSIHSRWFLLKNTDKKVIFHSKDSFGNVHYLVIEK